MAWTFQQIHTREHELAHKTSPPLYNIRPTCIKCKKIDLTVKLSQGMYYLCTKSLQIACGAITQVWSIQRTKNKTIPKGWKSKNSIYDDVEYTSCSPWRRIFHRHGLCTDLIAAVWKQCGARLLTLPAFLPFLWVTISDLGRILEGHALAISHLPAIHCVSLIS